MIGFVGRIAASVYRALRRPFERRLHPGNHTLATMFGGGSTTASGTTVSEDTALGHAAVFACVRILAETVASLPLFVYQRVHRGKDVARDHYLFRLLHRRPNSMMTAFVFWETMVAHLVLRGNAYAVKVFNGRGEVIEMWPVSPASVTPRWETRKLASGKETSELVYEISGYGILPAWRVLHLRGLGGDGICGYSVISMAREAIGLSLAAEESGARLFGNGSRPGGMLKVPGMLEQGDLERLKAEWESKHGGLENAHRLAVLMNGADWVKTGIDPEDAQMLETRRFQLSEIARIFRIPLHLLQDLTKASYATVEQQGIDFAVQTIRPWCVRIEQELLSQLFTEADQEDYFPEFKLDGLLRGDIQSRYNAYAIARQWGWMSVNDILNLENMNPVENGDIYLQPMNMIDAADSTEPDDTGAQVDAATGQAATVQDTALNGAQIASLVELTKAVAEGRLPGPSAVQMILVSFPSVDEATAEAIIAPAVDLAASSPPKPAPTAVEEPQVK